MLEGLRKPAELIVVVVGLLSYGCPLQAIVHVFGLDGRTVAAWRDRAEQHCQKVQQARVEQRVAGTGFVSSGSTLVSVGERLSLSCLSRSSLSSITT